MLSAWSQDQQHHLELLEMQVLGPHPDFLNQRLRVFKQQRLVVTSHPGGPDPGSSEHAALRLESGRSHKWQGSHKHKQQRQIPCPVFSGDPQTTAGGW